MKKIILSTALWLFAASCFAQTPFISKVRIMYNKAAKQKQTCEKLMKLLSPYNESNNPLLLGYKASATMMMAGHVFSPFSKLSYFKKGKQLLEEAINADKNNAELRFLRLAVQTNTPSFLGYDDHIVSDKKFLLQSLSQIDKTLRTFIISRLKNLNIVSDKFHLSKTIKS